MAWASATDAENNFLHPPLTTKKKEEGGFLFEGVAAVGRKSVRTAAETDRRKSWVKD